MDNMLWFETLNKPFLSPPDWIFTPVWTILYIMILISFILFVKGHYTNSKIVPLFLFFTQMTLNLAWPVAFFYLENITLGLYILGALCIFLMLTIISFYKYSKKASLLLVPYFCWTCFALYLNFGYYVLN